MVINYVYNKSVILYMRVKFLLYLWTIENGLSPGERDTTDRILNACEKNNRLGGYNLQ